MPVFKGSPFLHVSYGGLGKGSENAMISGMPSARRTW